MRKIILVMFAAIAATTAFAQSAKVVVNSKGEVVGRYVRTNANTFTIEAQDDSDVPKTGHKIVVFSAENGQGIVYCKNEGSINIRSTPSTSGTKVGVLRFVDGDMPETAQCLGKENGWYKIKTYEGITGYVRQDLVTWEPMDVF